MLIKTEFTVVIFFVLTWWNINEFEQELITWDPGLRSPSESS